MAPGFGAPALAVLAFAGGTLAGWAFTVPAFAVPAFTGMVFLDAAAFVVAVVFSPAVFFAVDAFVAVVVFAPVAFVPVAFVPRLFAPTALVAAVLTPLAGLGDAGLIAPSLSRTPVASLTTHRDPNSPRFVMPFAQIIKTIHRARRHNRTRVPARETLNLIKENPMTITMTPIGTVSAGATTLIRLDKDHAAGLEGLEGFSHVLVLWYAHENPPWDPKHITVSKPYRLAPSRLGLLVTRSPYRPNPILVSAVPIIRVDAKKGTIEVPWLDANDGSPVLDIKPYSPSVDRVRDVTTPDWCRHWPQYVEESMDFAWDKEFMF